MGKTKGQLTDRQRRFVDAYLEYGNASAAAREVGLSVAYSSKLKATPAVIEYLEQRRAQMPVQSAEVLNFLAAVMRGYIKPSQLRTEAAYQTGLRAGLWKSRPEAKRKIKEAASHE